jgi:ABC-type uncharacterized transport system auxiliary subunit
MLTHRACSAFSIACVLLLAACASTAPKANFSQDLVAHYKIDADDHAEVKVDAAPGVEALALDQQRIAEVIASKLEQRRLQNVANNDPKECLVQVTLTRYQRGNAFARAMLAGLGQIHIDASVKVYAKSNDQKIADFLVAKTFAWGGIYGASTSMEDIERTFADGVAAALTGQQEATKKDVVQAAK